MTATAGSDVVNLDNVALYRSPLTVMLWPSSFFEEVRTNDSTPASAPNQFSGCNGVSTYTCGLASLKCGVLLVDVVFSQVCFIAKAEFAYENRKQRQSRFGLVQRIYALLDHI
ncbi:hypothetical protein TNCV_5039341 [Trichonephila clavipes]|nr:hypothetical protein TNCV_5039341 [Trichonephila clavipes]